MRHPLPLPSHKMPIVKECEIITEDILINALRLNKACNNAEVKLAIENIEYFIAKIKDRMNT